MARLRKEPLLRYIAGGSPTDYSTEDDAVKAAVREIGVRNMFIQKRLHEVMEALRIENIPAIVLKGAHLMQSIYPFGIRPIEDIDLLVMREDFRRLDEVIRSMGYECDLSMGWAHDKISNKLTYLNESHPVIPIDIHFCLGPYPYLGRIHSDELFSHAESLNTGGGTLTVLRPEMLLIHLCLHLFQHHFDDWQVSCCDIVAVIRHHNKRLDWGAFENLVNSRKLGLPVSYSLQKARELSGMKIPFSIKNGNDNPGFMEKTVFLISQKQNAKSDRYFLQFLTTPGTLIKLRAGAKIIYPGKSFLRQFHQGSYFKYIGRIIKTAVKLTSAVFARRN